MGDQALDNAVANDLLGDLWRGLRDDASQPNRVYIFGAITMAERLGALTAEQAELWRLRTTTCPGHDDEGGRSWCAFCGVMEQDDG